MNCKIAKLELCFDCRANTNFSHSKHYCTLISLKTIIKSYDNNRLGLIHYFKINADNKTYINHIKYIINNYFPKYNSILNAILLLK